MSGGEGYQQTLDAMTAAAQQWMREHPFAGPFRFTDFEKEMAREAGHPTKRVAIIAPLAAVIDRWAANADTRSFLEALVEASKGEATFLQASLLIDSAFASALMRGSGRLPEGSWNCTGCGAKQDGFTNLDGHPERPGPGAISVCGGCGAIQRVTADGAGYEPLSSKAFGQLPKSLRKTLLAIKARVEEHNARERSRD